MAILTYYVQDYDKLDKYIMRKHHQDYLYISSDTKVKITLFPNKRKFDVDISDFIKVDMFLVEKEIQAKFDNTEKCVGLLIRENHVGGIDYLIESNFHCADIPYDMLIHFFVIACGIACLDIVIAFMTLIDWKKNGIHNSGPRSFIFGHRDADVIRVLLDHIPKNYIDYKNATFQAVQNGKLQNLVLLEEKYPEINVIEYIGLAIKSGSINILEYIVSKGANLQNFLRDDSHNSVITKCAENGHVEMIEYLFNNTFISDDQVNNYLKKAFDCKSEFIDILIDAGADFVLYGEELYQNALEHKNYELAQYLKKNYL